MLDFLYRLRIACSPDVVSSLRLVCASRGASRSFYPVVSRCLLVSFLFVSWDVSFFISFLISFYRLVSSRLVLLARLVSSYLRSPGWRLVLSRAAVPPSRHIVLLGPSCLLVSFFFPFVLSPCGYGMRRSCDDGVLSYHPDARTSRSHAVRSLIACPLRERDAVSVPVLRHPAMRRGDEGCKALGER